MKSYKIALLALSLSIGVMPSALALKNGDTRTEVERNITRGTNGTASGYWVDSLRKTYLFTEDPDKAGVRDAFSALMGREANDSEWAQWLAAFAGKPSADVIAKGNEIIRLYQSYLGRTPTSDELLAGINKLYSGVSVATLAQQLMDARLKGSGIENLDPALIADITNRIRLGALSLDVAITQIAALNKLAGENKNSNYLTTLPAEYLNWAPGKALSQAVIDQVGAEPREWENRFVNAYNGIGINPDTKVFHSGPLAGQKLATDFNGMVNQLTSSGYITFDWDYDTLIKDLGGQATLDSYGKGRGFWASNLFGKDNLNDSTLFQRYSTREGQDATTRRWVKSDGIGRFTGGLDMDILMAVNYSTAAKLMAESKALRAMGFTSMADAKLNQARNVVLLDGNDHDPLVLDLNGNGKIDVTGLSSSKFRTKENRRFIKEGSVTFDLLTSGKPIVTEWIKDGDGFLVDNTNNIAINTVKAGKMLTGANLFGDVDGYAGGFMKLGSFFDKESRLAATEAKLSAGFGVLKGDELKNLMVWIDNGDGITTLNELKPLPSLGITEIGVKADFVKEKGEMFEQSYFIQNGQKRLIQEVWFRSEK